MSTIPPVGPSNINFPSHGDSDEKPNAGMSKDQFNDTVDGVTNTAALSSPEAKKHFDEHEVKQLGQEMKSDRQQMKQQVQQEKKTELGG